MSDNPEPEKSSALRNPLIYSTTLLVIVAAVIGWIFYSRWEENRALAEQAAEKTRAQDQQTVEMMGGDNLEIRNLYVTPGTIHSGQSADICYSVANATQVQLDPPATEGVWPSYSRCVAVTPQKDTKYTLTAEDAAGDKKTATVTLSVR
jgi:hypothetical protein